jgi:hypothetical protein
MSPRPIVESRFRHEVAIQFDTIGDRHNVVRRRDVTTIQNDASSV